MKAIPTGKDNAISCRALARQFGCTKRDIFASMRKARLAGWKVCADMQANGGFYFPATDEELRGFQRLERARFSSTERLHAEIMSW